MFHCLNEGRGLKNFNCYLYVPVLFHPKKEWVNRAYENIDLSKYPYTRENLFSISDPIAILLFQALDIEAISVETTSIHYTAHPFSEQEGSKMLLLDIVKRLSVKCISANKSTKKWYR